MRWNYRQWVSHPLKLLLFGLKVILPGPLSAIALGTCTMPAITTMHVCSVYAVPMSVCM